MVNAVVIDLNPWTAKNVVITDFDVDRNGIFVGYLGQNLPEQLRDRLAKISQPADQYEGARAAMEKIIQDPYLVAAASFPLAVREFIERNAPGQKLLAIAKAQKADHLWDEAEPLAAAIWQANNPIGKAINQLMTALVPPNKKNHLKLLTSKDFRLFDGRAP
jgi:hypothetical protein